MGQVFTLDDLQFGRVPNKKSFHRVAKELRSKFEGESSIVTAVLFGSVIRGDFTIRSDIDCAVIYDPTHERFAMEAMHEVGRMACSLNVPINFTPCDTELAGTSLHHFGDSFIRHLERSIESGGLIKGNIVGQFASTVSIEEEIESYIKMKMYSMQEAFSHTPFFSDEQLARFYKKALEAPMHVARKMLNYEDALNGDSKREVQEQYQIHMPMNLVKQLDHLIDLDHHYTRDLENQLEDLNPEAYAHALARLHRQLPKVLEFLRSNIVHLDGAR